MLYVIVRNVVTLNVSILINAGVNAIMSNVVFPCVITHNAALLNAIMLWVIISIIKLVCAYCHHSKCYNVACCVTECHYFDCRNAECSYAISLCRLLCHQKKYWSIIKHSMLGHSQT